MRAFWKWLWGYVSVVLSGRQVNRFLNLCSRNGISFWRISYDAHRFVRANMRLKDFYLLKPFLRKTKTRLHIQKRFGFPFWCHRHPKLKWMCVALIFSICLFFYSLSFVWSIHIEGNKSVSAYELEQFLVEQNIAVGKKMDHIDCSFLEQLLREKYSQFGWISVYFKNTTLQIEIKESIYDAYEPEEIIPGHRYDLIANKDAIIHSIITRNGTAKVAPGAEVKQGQLLVEGQYTIYDDSGLQKGVLNVKASALIYADVNYLFVSHISEMELMAMKIANLYSEEMFYRFAFEKSNAMLSKLQAKDALILNAHMQLQQTDDCIAILTRVIARETFGITIPMEEIVENEFE